MADDNRVPTTPKQSAWLLAWGTFLCLIAPAALGASWYVHINTNPYSTEDASVLLAVVGWAILLLGAILLSVGVLRVAEHADRAAGVKAAYAAQQAPPTSD